MNESFLYYDDVARVAGQPLADVWVQICNAIEEKYDTDRLWGNGGKKWTYEYKYRRGGKTLCALYAKPSCIGLMIIFGKEERQKFEAIRSSLSLDVCRAYDCAETYHDGKWVMFEAADTAFIDNCIKLLAIKRKPNRISQP